MSIRSTNDWITEGVRIGFNYARDHPEQSLEDLLLDIESVRDQLRSKSTKELKLIVSALKAADSALGGRTDD